jgi:hypothetical protein
VRRYSDVSVKGWVHVADADFEVYDSIKVWFADGGSLESLGPRDALVTSDEEVLLEGIGGGGSSYNIRPPPPAGV